MTEKELDQKAAALAKQVLKRDPTAGGDPEVVRALQDLINLENRHEGETSEEMPDLDTYGTIDSCWTNGSGC